MVASTGDAADFERFVDGFRHAPTPQEQLRYAYSLAEFPTAELVLQACEFAMSGEMKSQNAPFVLARCIANRDHGAVAWRFVREHWQQANEQFPNNTIVRMIDPVKLLNTEQDLADVQGFFAEHAIPQAAKTLDQVLERQKVNVALRDRESARLAERARRRRRVTLARQLVSRPLEVFSTGTSSVQLVWRLPRGGGHEVRLGDAVRTVDTESTTPPPSTAPAPGRRSGR